MNDMWDKKVRVLHDLKRLAQDFRKFAEHLDKLHKDVRDITNGVNNGNSVHNPSDECGE